MKKVFIIGGGAEYNSLFRNLHFILVDKLIDADLVCFTGGADVSPELYGAQAHPYTGNDPIRDAHEQRLFKQALAHKIPMVGICRGGQFLNVMCGGEMYQHVEGHTAPHFITDLTTGEEVYVSSTHHQMMKPSPEAVLVASSTIGGSREWYEGQMFKRDISTQDIEVVFYEEQRCLCFQPHPEFTGQQYYGMRDYFSACLHKYLEV